MALIFAIQSSFVVRLLKQDHKLNLDELFVIYKYGYSRRKALLRVWLKRCWLILNQVSTRMI